MLDWKAKTARVSRAAHPKFQTQLTVSATSAELEELHTELSSAVSSNEELRWELEQGWKIYFKLRPVASRVQLAHPQLDEWVATLNLSPTHAQALLAALLDVARQGAGPVVLSRLADLGPFANLELVIAKS